MQKKIDPRTLSDDQWRALCNSNTSIPCEVLLLISSEQAKSYLAIRRYSTEEKALIVAVRLIPQELLDAAENGAASEEALVLAKAEFLQALACHERIKALYEPVPALPLLREIWKLADALEKSYDSSALSLLYGQAEEEWQKILWQVARPDLFGEIRF